MEVIAVVPAVRTVPGGSGVKAGVVTVVPAVIKDEVIRAVGLVHGIHRIIGRDRIGTRLDHHGVRAHAGKVVSRLKGRKSHGKRAVAVVDDRVDIIAEQGVLVQSHGGRFEVVSQHVSVRRSAPIDGVLRGAVGILVQAVDIGFGHELGQDILVAGNRRIAKKVIAVGSVEEAISALAVRLGGEGGFDGEAAVLAKQRLIAVCVGQVLDGHSEIFGTFGKRHVIRPRVEQGSRG